MNTKDGRLLYEEADQLFEENKLAEAVKTYRQAMQILEPNQINIMSFLLVDQYEKLNFAGILKDSYPESLDIQMLYANLLATAGQQRAAIDIYSKLLSEYKDEDANRYVTILVQRFTILCQDEQYGRALEDFERLWMESDKVYNPPMLRAVLIRALMRLDDKDAHLYLKMVYSKTFLPEKVRKIIFLKMKQAEMFAEFWAESRSNSVTNREDE